MSNVARQNLLAAETGGRTYRHLTPATALERSEAQRQAELTALAHRLRIVDNAAPKVKADHRYKELRDRHDQRTF